MPADLLGVHARALASPQFPLSAEAKTGSTVILIWSTTNIHHRPLHHTHTHYTSIHPSSTMASTSTNNHTHVHEDLREDSDPDRYVAGGSDTPPYDPLADRARKADAPGPQKGLITVQPLTKAEMQPSCESTARMRTMDRTRLRIRASSS